MTSPCWGFGPGYCYRVGSRALIAIAETERTVRLCIAPTWRIRAVRPYRANRKIFILQRP